VAAGRGERFGGALPKALEEVAGQALLAHTLDQVCAVVEVSQIVVAAPTEYIDEVTQLCASKTNGDRIGVSVVAGGRERADSVAAALTSVDEDVDVVLVHDAARAFAPAELFSRVISAVRNGSVAAVPALPVTDTIKEVNSEEIVLRTVARHSLRAVQTPQGFRRDVLVAAHADHQAVARAGDLAPTDDAGMVEAGGHDVLLVRGSDAAFKITTPFDRLIARAIVMQREEPDER
jgi:2-C-methyl-D-erythritol 4-phosphate cytidylyltransferase